MFADALHYRGFTINVEMIDGQFIASYHDPLKHQEDGFSKLTKTVADSHDAAIFKAHEWLDRMVAEELSEVETKASKLR